MGSSSAFLIKHLVVLADGGRGLRDVAPLAHMPLVELTAGRQSSPSFRFLPVSVDFPLDSYYIIVNAFLANVASRC
jgi:hypothetical protein